MQDIINRKKRIKVLIQEQYDDLQISWVLWIKIVNRNNKTKDQYYEIIGPLLLRIKKSQQYFSKNLTKIHN